MVICGWGRYPGVDATVYRPRTRMSARDVMSAHPGIPMIARGLGRSYGDSALGGHIIGTDSLNCLLDFDATEGVVRCAAGASLADLLDVFVPRGWFLPVTPGTKFVSVGGAIASDVHGKNHHRSGCFSEYVERIELLLADGEVVTCSRSEHSELFRATCGGMGLTGLILEATIRLEPCRSAFIEQTTLTAGDLAEALSLFDEHQASSYSVAWVDCLARGGAMGRSLVMLGEHSETGGGSPRPDKWNLSVPVDMPGALLNRFSAKAFNAIYYHSARGRRRKRRIHYESFFYPLDSIHDWNRLYGKSGFIQYQFVIPRSAGLKSFSAVLGKIVDSRHGSFLAVLKALGAENANLLSFPMEGYTLAVDFKLEKGLLELLNELDAMVVDHGGRLYLAKDARMSEATFKRSYRQWEAFQDLRERYGAKGRFCSRQSQRLGLD